MEARKRGRPKKSDGSMDTIMSIRLSKNDVSNLNYIQVETGQTYAEIIRDALRIYRNLKEFN